MRFAEEWDAIGAREDHVEVRNLGSSANLIVGKRLLPCQWYNEAIEEEAATYLLDNTAAQRVAKEYQRSAGRTLELQHMLGNCSPLCSNII